MGNEDGRWDGNCVINSYKDRKLIQITDAQYIDGILLNCKQIFSYTTNSERYDGFGMEVWAYSDRVNESDFNSGETWLYAKTRDFDQSFTADSITAENIYTADQFRINLETNFQLFAYYSGNTNGEYFNDQTGDAYMVYYFVDLDFEDKEKTSGLTEDQIYEKKSEMLGKIRMIYSGKFGGKGTFYDSSGKAWEIAIEINSDYMYYRGYFTDGKIPKKSVLERGYPPLSHDEVANYTSAITFNCPMNWYEASLDKGDSKSL